MPTQQVTKLKRQGREVVQYRDAKGRNRLGIVRAVSARAVPGPTFGLSAQTSGGTLADGTYYYRVSVVTTGAESLASAEQSVVLSGGGGVGQITITASAYTGSTAFKFYGRTTGAELQIASQAGLVFVDTGSVTPSGALPTLAKSTVTFDANMTGYAPIAGVTQAVAMRGAGTRYFKRYGTPAGYAQPARS
jgi:hypothetical protein